MTIEVDDEIIVLSGRCGAEEAEALLNAMCSRRRRVDLSGCEQLHTALLQILLAARAEIEWGTAPTLPTWLMAALSQPDVSAEDVDDDRCAPGGVRV